jgi:hypothetical protein
VDASHNPANLPSWAVDWTSTPRRVALPRTPFKEGCQKIYCAGGDSGNFSARFMNEDICSLVLKGMQIGKITFVESPNHNYHKAFPRTFEEAIIFGQRESRNASKCSTTILSWFKTWMTETDMKGSLSWKQGDPKIGPKNCKYPVYKYTQEELCHALTRICTGDIALTTDGTYMGRAKDIIPYDGSTQTPTHGGSLELAMRTYMPGRTFICTSQGMVGLAPEESRTEDLVCIITGNETPVVLRSCGAGRYTWVGECYIHGIMYGEYMELSKPPSTLETLSAEFCIV